MNTTAFERPSDEHLIVLECRIHKHRVFLALDSGATNTTIDLAVLMICGFDLSDAIREVDIETASGIIKGYIFQIKAITALGRTLENVEIVAYDFFSHHILPDFDGVLGLDFFVGTKVCVDFRDNTIVLHD